MSLINCPECNHEMSDTAKSCPNCGYNVKKYLHNKSLKQKSTRMSIIVVIVAICVILILEMLLLIGKGSLKIATNIIKTGSFECIEAHDFENATCQHGQICKRCGSEIGKPTDHKWQEATCEHGRICEYCNAEEGEKTDHKWEEATCTSPEKCNVCGKEEGSALGHSCQIGYCSNCGVYVTDLINVYTEIKGHIDNASNMMAESMEYLGNARRYSSSSASNIEKANDINMSICDEFDAAINACGDYDEFNKVKTYLMQAKGKIYLFDAIQNNELACYTYVIEISQSLGNSAESVTEAYYALYEYAE